MRILIVEDDRRIARPLVKDLQHQHHVVDWVEDGQEGWDYAQAADYDLILLDWMLPYLDGVSLCKKLRETGCQALILMLTAKDTTGDKVIGLDAGADDYLVKPFRLEELSARIRALCRRSRTVSPAMLCQGHLCLDPSTHQVTYAGQALDLTPKEYVLLEYFLRHPGQVLTRAALVNQLWAFDTTAGEGAVKTHLSNLRTKLKQAGSLANLIDTVYGVGYRLQAVAPSRSR
jgi:two-component system response regulator QseB